jgi:hypothetical protein
MKTAIIEDDIREPGGGQAAAIEEEEEESQAAPARGRRRRSGSAPRGRRPKNAPGAIGKRVAGMATASLQLLSRQIMPSVPMAPQEAADIVEPGARIVKRQIDKHIKLKLDENAEDVGMLIFAIIMYILRIILVRLALTDQRQQSELAAARMRAAAQAGVPPFEAPIPEEAAPVPADARQAGPSIGNAAGGSVFTLARMYAGAGGAEEVA